MSKVREVMTRNIFCASPFTPITEAAQEMRKSEIGVVCICHNGKFRGLITEREMSVAVGANVNKLKNQRVGSLLNKHHPKISPGDEIMQAAKVMLRNAVQELPVVQNGKLFGLLKFDDIARQSPGVVAMLSTKLLTVGH